MKTFLKTTFIILLSLSIIKSDCGDFDEDNCNKSEDCEWHKIFVRVKEKIRKIVKNSPKRNYVMKLLKKMNANG